MEKEKKQGGGTMRKEKCDEWLAQQTGESIAIRMESFGDEFDRLASTVKQAGLAGSFCDAVSEIVRVPLTAAELQPLEEWLKGCGTQFEQGASTADQKKLAASFLEFISEISSPEVKEVFQRPLVNKLVEEITSALAYGHSNGIPVALLSDADKVEYLEMVIDWTDYINRGLDLKEDMAEHIRRIVDNAIAGNPREQWMGQTGPLDLAALSKEIQADEAAAKRDDAHYCSQAFQNILDGKTLEIEKGKNKGIERGRSE